jgi:hypothetical protein
MEDKLQEVKSQDATRIDLMFPSAKVDLQKFTQHKEIFYQSNKDSADTRGDTRIDMFIPHSNAFITELEIGTNISRINPDGTTFPYTDSKDVAVGNNAIESFRRCFVPQSAPSLIERLEILNGQQGDVLFSIGTTHAYSFFDMTLPYTKNAHEYGYFVEGLDDTVDSLLCDSATQTFTSSLSKQERYNIVPHETSLTKDKIENQLLCAWKERQLKYRKFRTLATQK